MRPVSLLARPKFIVLVPQRIGSTPTGIDFSTSKLTLYLLRWAKHGSPRSRSTKRAIHSCLRQVQNVDFRRLPPGVRFCRPHMGARCALQPASSVLRERSNRTLPITYLAACLSLRTPCLFAGILLQQQRVDSTPTNLCAGMFRSSLQSKAASHTQSERSRGLFPLGCSS